MITAWREALAAIAFFGFISTSAMAQNPTQGELKQVRLTDKQIQGLIAAQKDLAPLSTKLESTGGQPDPALQTEIDKIAKENGFSSAEELDDVAANVSVVLGGLDPQSGQFTEPPDQIKKDIDELKQDTQLSKEERDQALAEMQEALKAAAPLQFKENVALVKKYKNELDATLSNETTKQ